MIQAASIPVEGEAAEPSEHEDRYLPARMINEVVYCKRLFYLMHVEGQFERNACTVEGDGVHRRVDQKTDALASPAPIEPSQPATPSKPAEPSKPTAPSQRTLFDLIGDEAEQPQPAKTEPQAVKTEPWQVASAEAEPAKASPEPVDEPTIHARSVTLASDRLGVVAKLDLIEAQGRQATPVDYKRGRPRMNADGMPDAWNPERVQLCLQALVLRENGFQCDRAVVYYHATRQRVTIPIDDALIRQAQDAVRTAREVAELPRPPAPLVGSPKCPQCSLSAVCLPDETNRCRAREGHSGQVEQVRLPATPRDDLKPLYLNTQGLCVGKKSELLVIKDRGKVVQNVRLRDINQVCLFGNIQLSTQAMQALLFAQIPTVLFTEHGYFYGMLHGTGLKNILLRREQFRLADDPARTLPIAKSLVAGKIRNQRVLLMRNHVSPPAGPIAELKRLAGRVEKSDRAETLLGIEGYAARIYFQHFSGMIKAGDQPIDPANLLAEGPRYSFDFQHRNRRPPRDPVNAMLSLAYTLLAKDLTVTAAAVGFDPYLGFYHLPRPGRPALALDLMEPFRALLADSAVITAINNRMVTPEHFVEAGRGVTMTKSGRKAFIRAYEQRMDQLVTHPLFDYRVSYRRLLEIQTRLMARVVSGELTSYPVFVTR